jgi:hypothetical protein
VLPDTKLVKLSLKLSGFADGLFEERLSLRQQRRIIWRA